MSHPKSNPTRRILRGLGWIVFWLLWIPTVIYGTGIAVGVLVIRPWWEQHHGPITNYDQINYDLLPLRYAIAYITIVAVLLPTPAFIRVARKRWINKWRYGVRKSLHLKPPPPPITNLGTWTATEVLELSPGWGNGYGTVWYGTVQGNAAPEGRTAKGEAGVLVVGPPRSGKTSGVIIPTVLAFNGPVVSASTKDDVLKAVGKHRQSMGTLWLFDPTGSTPLPPGVTAAHWSPLVSVKDWDSARDVAAQMVKAEDKSQNSHSDAGDFFRGRATDLIASALFTAHTNDHGFLHVLDVLSWPQKKWVKAVETLEERVAESGTNQDYLALQAANRLAQMASREYSAMIGTASNTLAAYQRTSGLETTTDPNFDPEDFVGSGDTLFIIAAGAQMAEVAPIIVALVDTITQTRYRHHTQNPGTARLLLALDEIANLCPLPSITSMWSEAGGQGVTLLAAVQDLTQVKQRWGPDHGWLSLATQKLLLPGIADHETLSALSAMQGEFEHWRQTQSHTRSNSPVGPGIGMLVSQRSATVADQYTWRPNVPIDVFAQIPDGYGRIIIGAQDAGLVELTPSHRHSLWEQRTGPPIPIIDRKPSTTSGLGEAVIDLVSSGSFGEVADRQSGSRTR